MNVALLVELGLIPAASYGILTTGKVKNGEFKESESVL